MSRIFTPDYCCYKEEKCRWPKRSAISSLRNLTFRTCERHHLIGARFSYHSRNMRLKFPQPVTQLKAVLGFDNLSQRFGPSFAWIAAQPDPHWKRCQHSSTNRLLTTWRPQRPYSRTLYPRKYLNYLATWPPNYLDSDSCDRQIGCLLMQDHRNGTKKALGIHLERLT